MKELRLGLVCYGGVSLAIYMHGITSELHNLVRASEARTKHPDGGNPFPENTTEHVYFEILERIAATRVGDPPRAVPLRVIVDVIAGTSAGGINGVALAKALAHDLDQAPLKQVWLDKASIWKLLSLSKLLKREAILNGDRMLRWVHQALSDMNKKEPDDPSSLMPRGHQLDLFVTLTDCTGYRRTIDIHDPVAIFDREHRHVLSFSYQKGTDPSDFGPSADPGLALAIRCTSSFPVAFAPVSIEDVSAVAKSWAENGREAFIATAFAPYVLENAQPTSAYFVDGGVLNNRPFDRAVQAILKRSANHEVDRRLLFIEPHPAPTPANPEAQGTAKRPHLTQTARAALISIPSHQPIADALLDLARYNQRVLQIKHLVEVLKPKVDDLINTVIGAEAGIGTLDLDKLLDWDKLEARREEVRQHAETAAGAAFHSYAALKIDSVLEHLTSAICRLQRYPPGSRQAILVARIVPAWAKRAKIMTDQPDLSPEQIEFLQVFDLGYRRRRLRFLVEYVNQLYPPSPIERLPPRDEVDAVKTELYALMEELQVMGSGEWLAGTPRQQLDEVFARAAIETADGSPAELAAFLEAHADIITSILAELKAGLNDRLTTFNKWQAEGLSKLREWNWERSIMGDLVARYLGFAYWDLLLYPIQALSEIAELDTIEVIRISPADTKAFNDEDDSPQPLKSEKHPVQHLKGVGLAHFGAFLRRSYRENDLLWGRLDGVERLFGILASVASESGVNVDRRLMWQGLQAVLASEAPNLRSRDSKRLLARLRAKVEGQLAADDDRPPGEPPLLRMDEAAD